MFLYLALALLAGFVYLSYKNIVWGIFLIVVFLPSYLWRLSFYGWPSTFLEMMILLLFIVWLFKNKLYKKINYTFNKYSYNILPKSWRMVLSLWLFISFIGLLTNFSLSSIGLWRAYWLEPLMFFLILIYNIKNRKDLVFILKGLAALVTGLFVVAIWQYFSEWNLVAAYKYPNVKRLTALYAYPNALALLVAPIASFFAIWWLEEKNKIKNIWRLCIFIFGFVLVVVAVSQGAMVAILTSVFFYLILAKKIRKFGIPFVLGALFLAAIFLPVNVYWKSFEQQLLNPELGLSATSLEIRSNQWQETARMLQDNFIFGAGIGAYQNAMEPYRQYNWIETYLYPHNIFLNFWTEIGLGGMILFIVILFFIIRLLKDIFVAKNIFAWPLTATWLTWFVHGLVDVPYFKNDLSLLFFIILAITFSVHKSREDGEIY